MTNITEQNDICHSIYKVYHNYVDKLLNSVGLVLNILSVIVFIKLIASKNAKSDMFKYLMIKSIFDAYYNFRNLIFIVNDCINCSINGNKYFLVFVWIFVTYFGFVAQFLSICCEIGATYDRYQHISNKLKIFKRTSYKINLSIAFIFSLIFYLNKILERTLKTRSNSTHYILIFNSLGSSELALNIDFLQSFIKNGVCVLIILILNILSLISIRKSMGNKRRMINRCNNKSENLTLKRNKSIVKLRVVKTELKVTMMVLTTGFLTILGHGLMFVYNLPLMIRHANFCLYSVTNFLFYLSITFNFVIYFSFYKNFRITFKNIIFK